MSRNLLHKTKLPAFKSWLDAQGIPHRAPRGTCEMLQVQAAPPDWFCVFDRLNAPEHYTVDHRLERIVQRFIRVTKTKS